ncbi:MAG: bifunctional nuclease family protein [Elusimicrobiota bacterium]
MIKCKVETVTFDELSQMGVVILTEIEGDRVLPIWIGLFEAQAILFRLQNSFFPRPLTHDLLKNCLEKLGGKTARIIISKVEQSTYHAEIVIIAYGKEIKIDSRPSDAIALAVRAQVPILVDNKVMDENGIKRDEFVKEQKEKIYKKYLETFEEEDSGKLKH